jgi:hypothetical protein
MTPQEVQNRLCMLTTKVMEKQFSCHTPADCWCGQKEIAPGFQFSEDIIKFIEEAVEEKLKRG